MQSNSERAARDLSGAIRAFYRRVVDDAVDAMRREVAALDARGCAGLRRDGNE